MDLSRLLSVERHGPAARSAGAPPGAGDRRSPFQIDQDRIIYSRPFRRLQAKTQVHPLPANDHVRNRLVHTLEVASAGRDLGVAVGQHWQAAGRLAGLGLDAPGQPVTPAELGYLVQAACLAHDIGNPTFGHAGEEAISHWLDQHLDRLLDEAKLRRRIGAADLADLKRFEGNAQGFRILTKTDNNRYQGGLRLTAATLSAFMKYPWRADQARAAGKPQKWGVYRTEWDAAQAVLDRCGHARDGRGIHARNPLVYLMEAADDLCYTVADFEDAHDMGIVTTGEFVAMMAPFAGSPESIARYALPLEKVGYLRGRAIGKLIDTAARAFLDHEAELFAGRWPGARGNPATGNPQARYGLLDLVEARGAAEGAAFARIKRFNREKVYRHPRKAEIEVAAHEVLGALLAVFLPAFLAFRAADGDDATLRNRHRQALAIVGEYAPARDASVAETVRCAIDFVAGMTDRYAATLHRRLRGEPG
ncbi:MAG: dNTP triphosphohydrolase [Alphaproteobacteria bacterium]|nr:dNTP triphosphohydrolase [Alphaproteobacteria bacterium]